MVKRKKKVTSAAADTNVVILSNGERVKVKPVPPLLVEIVAETIALPKPPVGQVKTAWGGMEEYEILDHPKYMSDLAAAQEERDEIVWNTRLLLGVDEEPPEDDSWTEILDFLGVDVPDNKEARKLLWIKTVLIQKGSDSYRLSAAIVAQTRATPEEIAEIGKTFLGPLQRAKAAADEAKSR